MHKQKTAICRLAAVIAGFSALVITIVGLGACSPIGEAFPPDAPTEVSAERGNEEAIVHFTEPEGTVTGYIVISDPEGKTATGTSSPITVTGLTNGRAYSFAVVATNAAGSSSASAASAIVVPMTTPGAPHDLAAKIGDKRVELTWMEPASNGGGTITGYEVSSDGGASYIPASSSTGHAFTGLANNRAYEFCVRAVNEVGADAHATLGAMPSNMVIPTSVGETFIDDTGFEWRVLAITDGNALVITEHVHGMNTRYHSTDGFRPFQTAEISEALNEWYNNDAAVSPSLKSRALAYGFQLDTGVPGGNGVEDQAVTWVSTPASTNQAQARTIPGGDGNGGKAFILSISEMNEYFENDISVRVAHRVSEAGIVGEPAYWWLRSPSTHAEYTTWLVGPDGYFYFDPSTHATEHLGFRPALWVTL